MPSDNFRSALPYNRQAGQTGAPDITTTLFSDAYINGVPLGERVPDPPPMLSQAVSSATSELNEPNWTDVEGDMPPETKGGGPSNGRWYYWDGTKSLTVQLHNNQSILAIWFPQEPPQIITIQSGQGASGGIGIYNTNPVSSAGTVASEIVAIPSGHESLTLTASAAFITPILVLVSGEPYTPARTFSTTNVPNQLPLNDFQNSGGFTTILAGAAGKRIFVLSYDLLVLSTAAGIGSFEFTDGGANVYEIWTPPTTNTLHQLASGYTPLYGGAIGQPLEAGTNLAGVAVYGTITYVQV